MKKKWFAAVNAALASLLVVLGFSSCKTSSSAQKEGGKKETEQRKVKELGPDDRRLKALYGVPNARYRERVFTPEEQKGKSSE